MTTETKPINYVPSKLPEIWIDEAERTKHRGYIISIEGWLNNMFREAIEKEGLAFNLSLIRKLRKSDTAVYDLMYVKYNEYIKSNSFIPKVEKERVKGSYIEVADRLKDVCNTAYCKLALYNFTLIEDKEGLICFAPNEVEEYINSIGVRTFTDKEQEYAELLDKATKALVEAANFERGNGIRDYALAGFGVMLKHDDPLNTIAYPCGLAHDAKMGIVNFERIVRGVMK